MGGEKEEDEMIGYTGGGEGVGAIFGGRYVNYYRIFWRKRSYLSKQRGIRGETRKIGGDVNNH